MAQQNNYFLYTMLSFFMVLAVGMGVAWGMAYSDAAARDAELAQARSEKTDADASVRRLNDEKTALLELIGREGADVGQQNVPDTVVGDITTKIEDPRYSNLSAENKGLEPALDKAVTDRDSQATAANSRQTDLQNKNDELQRTIKSKDAEMQVHQGAREQAELELQQQAAKHSEQIDRFNEEFVKMQDTLENLQTTHDTYVTETNRRVTILESDIREKRAALQALRRELFEQEDISFTTADGVVSSVDHINGHAYVNLGSKDEVRVGTTFSVYVAKHGGIGRRNTRDIKASIEIVGVMGPHLSEAQITRQDLHRPIANGDPIYSPIFTAGLPVEVAIAGLVDFDGSAGSDRATLLRMIVNQGARVAVQVGDAGEFISQNGESMSEEEATDSITSSTRFLIIADLGEEAADDTDDQTRLATYSEIQINTGKLQLEAENHGVYEIGLATFLEFLGYTKKHIAWRRGEHFSLVLNGMSRPLMLPNGAKSRSVRTSIGNRTSSGTVSELYTTRKRPRTISQGHVSELYK